MYQQILNLISDKGLSLVLVVVAVGAYKLNLPPEAAGTILGAGLLAWQHNGSPKPPYQP